MEGYMRVSLTADAFCAPPFCTANAWQYKTITRWSQKVSKYLRQPIPWDCIKGSRKEIPQMGIKYPASSKRSLWLRMSWHSKAERQLADLAQHWVGRTQNHFLLLLSVPSDEGSPLSPDSGQTGPSLQPADMQAPEPCKVLVQKCNPLFLPQGTWRATSVL